MSIKRIMSWVVLFAILAVPARAQTVRDVVLSSLSNAAIGAYDQGSFYVGPYGFQVQGIDGLVDFYCVDFLHRAESDPYSAYFTHLNGGDLSSTRLGSGSLGVYQQAAYLADKFDEVAESEWGGLHAAIWKITGQASGQPNSYATGGDADDAGSWITDAQANAGSYDVSYWQVVTHVEDGELGPGQEYLTYVTPEPGTMLLLGTGLAGLAAAGRRRRAAMDELVEEDGDSLG